MNAEISAIAHEMLTGSFGIILNLLKVIIPLMIVIEILIVYKVVEKIAVKLSFLGKVLGINKKAVLPLMVGLLLGITFGAGTLDEMQKRDPLSKKDLTLLGIFLLSCHGIIETTYIFGIIGGSVLFLLPVRLAIAIIITAIAARLPFIKKLDSK